MLKKFFISMLGTIAGLWLTIFIGVVLVIALFSSLLASSVSTEPIKDGSILHIKLDGSTMLDYGKQGDFWTVVRDGDAQGETFVDVLDAIRLSAKDARIKGIYLDCGTSDIHAAQREEITNALRDFRETGKWVIAYADNYSQGDFMIASVADEVIVNPVGSVNIHGVVTQVPFFAGLLDKVGVKMQVVRVGEYKSAIEPFTLTKMSEASHLQYTEMIDSLWDFTAGSIATGRGLDIATVRSYPDSIIAFKLAKDIAGLVTDTKYRREVEDYLRSKVGIDKDKDLPFVTPTEYIASNGSSHSDKHVAVFFAEGDIVDTGGTGISADVVVPQILELADDDDVCGLVLRINSGGGSAFASEQIWEALEYFKSKNKPLYVSMGGVAASGGYYIACGADSIYTDRTTITGSIGVFGMIPDISGLMTGHLGINFTEVTSNENALLLNTNKPLPQEQFDALQAMVETTYDIFTSRVAAGRGLEQDSVKAIGQGRVWIGGRAVEIGLADCVGGLDAAITDMVNALGLDRRDVAYYPALDEKMWLEWVRQARGNVQMGGVTMDATTRRLLHVIDYVSNAAAVQAHIEPIEFK